MTTSPSRPDRLARLPRILAATAALSAAYSAANHWHWRAPLLLPYTALDRLFPLTPWAMWLYVSHFVLLPFGLFALHREDVFARALRAVLIAAGLSTVFFFLCPTEVLRPEASGVLFDAIRLVDTPANCFPSLHVALSFIVAWGLIEDGRPWAPLAALWAAAIAASTMLVKQHCALDVAGGLLVAALAVRLARRAAPAPVPAGEPA